MTATEKEALALVEKRYKASADFLAPIFADAHDNEDLYFGKIDNSKNPWKSSVFDPEAFEKVERMVAHTFATEPKGRFLPREQGDYAKADIIDALFRYQWNRPGQNMFQKIKRMGQSAAIYGIGYGILEWRYEIRDVKKPVGEAGMYEEVPVEDWDDWYFRDLYFYDCFPDPSAIDMETMDYFIYNDYVTLSQLKATNSKKQGVTRYKNLGKLETKIKDEDGEHKASQESDRVQGSNADGNNPALEMYNRILVRRYLSRNRWISVCPDYNLVIEDRENPFWHGELPIHVITDHEFPNRLIGRGEIEPIKKLQKGLNNVLNQRLDNVKMNLTPVIKSRANSKYAHTWKWKPGYKWQMDDMDDVDVFQVKDVTGATFMQTANYFKDSIAQTLGNYDVLTRGKSQYDQTATEAKLTSGEQNSRFRQKEIVVDAFVKRLTVQAIMLDQQFITKPKVIRILGSRAKELMVSSPLLATELKQGDGSIAYSPMQTAYNGEQVDKIWLDDKSQYGFLIVDKEDIGGDFDFVVDTGSMSSEDPGDQFSNLALGYNLIIQTMPFLQQQGITVQFRPVLENMLTKLGMKNLEDVFIEAPQQPQMPMDPNMQGQPGQIPTNMAGPEQMMNQMPGNSQQILNNLMNLNDNPGQNPARY